MGLLKPLGRGQGYLKAGFLGFPKSGKTWTATDLAIGVYKMFDCGDIIFFDTEGGSEYIAARIEVAIGKPPLGIKARSLQDLLAVTQEVKKNDVLIVDSITHPWRELCDSFLARINEGLRKRNIKPRTKLEFQDWGPIKLEWAKWADWYLNSPVHCIICGRSGYEYAMEYNEELEKKELTKTGTKMKTESEFGFEPSLLVEMERVARPGGRKATQRMATVIGDRYGVLDGKTFYDPKFAVWMPHLQLLKPDSHSPIDVALKTDLGLDDGGETDWQREKKQRGILAEEIQGLFHNHLPGQTASDKSRRVTLLYEAFETRSWTAVENLPAERLRQGLEYLRSKLERSGASAQEEAPQVEEEPVIA